MLETFLVVQTLGMAVYVIIILIQSVWEKISKSSKDTEFEEFFTKSFFSEDKNFLVISARKSKDCEFREAYIASVEGKLEAYIVAYSEEELEKRIQNEFKKLMKERKIHIDNTSIFKHIIRVVFLQHKTKIPLLLCKTKKH